MKEEAKAYVRKLYETQRFLLILLLVVVYSGFICLLLLGVQAIADFNYDLFELLALPVNVAMFVSPVIFIVYLIMRYRYVRVRGKERWRRKSVLQMLAVTISLLLVLSISFYHLNGVTTFGGASFTEKRHYGNKYYVYPQETNLRLQVSESEFHLIELDVDYSVTYTWNKLSPNKAKLKAIKPS